MKLSAKKQLEFDLTCQSLIGKNIEIIDSKNKNQIAMKGRIIYESAKLLYLEYGGSIKRILKSNVAIKFEHEGKALNMDGRLLFSTIINRIKKIK
ncbi:MAG: ribonuclease P protein subunit [Nanoarchaeota archaeon]|nr:ribonuclease P protein subunit [Nanoarchaeota archaeon]